MATQYAPGRVLTPPQEAIVTGPVVFLAGPIKGAEDWQTRAIERFRLDPSMGHVTFANPRNTSNVDGQAMIPDFSFLGQVNWESMWLRRAADFGLILFWLAPEFQHFCNRAYAQTTRWELSEWKERKEAPLIVGMDEKSPGATYARTRLGQDRPDIIVQDTLEATVDLAKTYIFERWP